MSERIQTPRTDAAQYTSRREPTDGEYYVGHDSIEDEVVPVEICREIEEELEELKGKYAIASTIPLTHSELVDAFPAIVGVRTGFVEERLTGVNDFGMASEARTPCARACCVVVLSLLNGCGCSLGYCLGAMDEENKTALASLMAQVVARGVAL